MNRQQKELVINSLRQDFQDSKASFLVILRGMSVAEIQSLRKGLRGKGGKLKVAKTRLMKLAAKDTECGDVLSSHLKDQLGIIFSRDDVASVAKVLYDFSKSHEQLKVVGGCLEARFIGNESLEFIATLPSREVLLAQLCAVLNAPITQCVRVLNAPMVQLVMVLKHLSEKKTES